MKYAICPKSPGELDVEVLDDDGRRWLVTITRVEDGDQLVQVFGLGEAPLGLIEPEILTHTVGHLRMPHEADLCEIAHEVNYILATRRWTTGAGDLNRPDAVKPERVSPGLGLVSRDDNPAY